MRGDFVAGLGSSVIHLEYLLIQIAHGGNRVFVSGIDSACFCHWRFRGCDFLEGLVEISVRPAER